MRREANLAYLDGETSIRGNETGLSPINALPGKWDDCTLKPGQTPIALA
jgi:hypothetical protein